MAEQASRLPSFEERMVDTCAQYLKYNVCHKMDCGLSHWKQNEVHIVECHEEAGFYRVTVTTTTQPKVNRPCIFFMRGTCRKGNNCRFIHDPSMATDRASPTSSSGPARAIRGRDVYSLPSTSRSCAPTSPLPVCENLPNGSPHHSKHNHPEGAAASVLNKSWAEAAEFVPHFLQNRSISYAGVVSQNSEDGACGYTSTEKLPKSQQPLCPYLIKDGTCKFAAGQCNHLHGELCDLCGRPALHPFNEELRKRHRQECIKEHEKNMEMSFALARSKDKSCGVCFEVVMEKAEGEQRFGILPNCNHCFCLSCIRKWRQARQFENKIIRACPECRITSDFVCPSMYWVDTKEDKDKVIEDYKNALAKKPCKYFKKGDGKCPFGNKCFYMHALSNGRVVDVGPPTRQRRRHQGEMDVLQHVILWDFLEERENPWQTIADDLEDLASYFTDSEESDWSDYEFYYD